tara:strand:- start:5372 stop:5575 length:204 start_codon:yes stop_codon:yes gene_type:complete
MNALLLTLLSKLNAKIGASLVLLTGQEAVPIVNPCTHESIKDWSDLLIRLCTVIVAYLIGKKATGSK